MVRYESSAGCVIFYRKEKDILFLLVKSTYWGFVKGLIEKDENVEGTIKREAQEEAGLKNLNLVNGFKHVQKWFYKFQGELVKKEAVFLLAEVSEQEAKNTKISFEHTDFKWATLQEALELLKIKQNREMLQAAYDFINDSVKKGVKKDEQKRLF